MSNGNGKSAEERKGCLPRFLHRLASVQDQESLCWPYRVRDDFLSPAEASFFRVLALAAQDKFLICPKVGLKDIFFVIQPHENQGAFNKIARKNVDFLLCDRTSLKPVIGIELDDSSHKQDKRVERDRFVDAVFNRAGLPLLRVPVTQNYSPEKLHHLISETLGDRPPSQVQATPIHDTQASVPICPKCSAPMVVRTAGRGDNKGRQFYGCINYPNCREIAPLAPNVT